MGFLEVRSNIKVLNPPDPRAQACVRSAPERVVLDVAPGVTPSDKPPVRVFLGSEPGQYRAERVFVYSIEKNRDPSRVYEIYLMKDLAGFDRRGWTTGFTNYRFAIPHLAGRQGRAIFNDVDEAYCGDPADLFDAEMGNHGYLATSDTETSVMLIDCARMAPVWKLDAVQQTLKKEVLRNTLRECPGIRGDLPSEWTARDNDFVPGFSKLQHWTTLQTQPWRPVPGRFVYQPNQTGQLWFDLKDAADAEGYQIFGPTHPSSLYTDRIERIKASPLRRERLPADIASQGSQQLENALEESGSRTLLEVDLTGRIRRENSSLCSTIALTHHDLATSGELPETCDGVVCRGVLELLPDEDVPWVIDALFAHARRFVCVEIDNETREESLADASTLTTHSRDVSWWMEHFSIASRRHPEIRWSIAVADPADGSQQRPIRVRDGGRRQGESPRVWVLCDGQRENSGQALALANALDWPFERKNLRFERSGMKLSLAGSHSNLLEAPWPDVIIAAGQPCAEQACWIREQDQGRTRIVEVGRRGGEVADRFDVVVTPAYAHLWPHPNRVETAAPLALDVAKRQPPFDQNANNFFGDAPRPHVALLVDAPRGASLAIRGLEEMAASVRSFTKTAGGTAVAVVGRGLSYRREREALQRGLGRTDSVRAVPPGVDEEAFSGALAAADVVVVAGNDETLVAEAAASAKSVYIYPIKEQDSAASRLFRTWVKDRANTRPLNARGTPRPQQGLEYLCARLIEQGYVSPPLDREELHKELYRRGVVQPFSAADSESPAPGKRLQEADEIAQCVRSLLGYPSPSDVAKNATTQPQVT